MNSAKLNTNRNRAARWAAWAVAAAALLGAAGCETYHDTQAFQLEPHPANADRPYRVTPPDVLQIKSPEAAELNTQQIIVGPDGSIELPLLGKVDVSGLTTDEIARMLEQKAGKFYQHVSVAVNVTSYRSRHIYVFGEVAAPGRYAYTGSDTVLGVLAVAQPTRLADRDRIQILRPGGDGKTAQRMTIELSDWIEKGETHRNAMLEDGDIIYVPPNALAQVGLVVQQVLMPVSPAAATMRGASSIEFDSTNVGRGGTP